jgi:hypothetical protein
MAQRGDQVLAPLVRQSESSDLQPSHIHLAILETPQFAFVFGFS